MRSKAHHKPLPWRHKPSFAFQRRGARFTRRPGHDRGRQFSRWSRPPLDVLHQKDSSYVTVTVGRHLDDYLRDINIAIKHKKTKTVVDVVNKIISCQTAKTFRACIINKFVQDGLLEGIIESILCDDIDTNNTPFKSRSNKEDDDCRVVDSNNDDDNDSALASDMFRRLAYTVILLLEDSKEIITGAQQRVILERLCYRIARSGKCRKHLNVEILDNLLDLFSTDITSRRKSFSVDVPFYKRHIGSIAVFPTSDDIERDSYVDLPKNNIDGTYNDKDEYLKTHFHLLREDNIIPIREGIRLCRQYVGQKMPRRCGDLRLYTNIRIVSEYFDNHGISCVLSNVERAKSLKYGTLVILSFDVFHTFYFATVTGLDKSGEVFVQFEKLAPRAIQDLKYQTFTMAVPTTGYFKPCQDVLKVLQSFSNEGVSMPFENYIVKCDAKVLAPRYLSVCHDSDDTDDDVDIRASHSETFSSYEESNSQLHSLSPINWENDNVSSKDGTELELPLVDEIKFDEFQRAAFLTAISKEMSLVQGPPGCGKTFVGLQIVKRLLLNAPKLKIMIVCYTNHALDQFLELLVKSGIKNLIRVGGRSKSIHLESYLLKSARKDPQYKDLKHSASSLRSKHAVLTKRLTRLASTIRTYKENIVKTGVIKEEIGHLLEQFAWIAKGYDRLDTVLLNWLFDKDIRCLSACRCKNTEAVIVCTHCLSDSEWKKKAILLLTGTAVLSSSDIDSSRNIFDPSFPINERWCLYRGWVKSVCDKISYDIESQYDEFDTLSCELKEANNAVDIQILQDRTIIGITTSKAAESWEILNAVQPQVVIAEEAAEVFESHLLSCLVLGCQQLIMIGDHQQLRPKPSVYELEKHYRLDISMFERLIRNDFPCDQLRVQHRMRPEISANLRFFYKALEDHSEVKQYNPVMGISQSLFWIDHTCKEDTKRDCDSYTNMHEVNYVVALCQYILLQGYLSSQITVLTMYKGQMFAIQKEISSISRSFSEKLKEDNLNIYKHGDVGNVRVDVVDNFQGEENDIIILSLVRGNDIGKTGFVGQDNRICVSLSRAKQGLYIIGNSKTLRRNRTWRKIFEYMEKRSLVSNSLTLLCQNHTEQTISAASKADFLKWPKGGCKQRCPELLDCGHSCPSTCHFINRLHLDIVCKERCTRSCKHGHACSRKCHEDCSIKKCQESVHILLDQCGHFETMKCHQDTENHRCFVDVHYVRECGHQGNRKCYQEENFDSCLEIVEKRKQCGHTEKLVCHKANAPCQLPCDRRLKPCGHFCSRKCHEDCLAVPCEHVVLYTRQCGHPGMRKCFQTDNFDSCSKEGYIKRKPCGHRELVICANRKDPCKVKVTYIRSCGHRGERMCHETNESELCVSPVTFVRKECCHVGKKRCSDKENPCPVLCGLLLLCGHKCEAVCGDLQPHNTGGDGHLTSCSHGHTVKCNKPCETVLQCGHKCSGTCADCFGGIKHKKCQKEFVSYLVCGHKYKGFCADMTKHVCKECNNIYIPYYRDRVLEVCEVCDHLSFKEMCTEIQGRNYCNQPCQKRLHCGHLCIGLCGEPCPKMCKCCHKECFKGLNPMARYVQLADCGDLIRADVMDMYMNSSSSKVVRKACPVCGELIQSTRGRRYRKIIEKMWDEIYSKRGSAVKNVILCNRKQIKDFFETRGITLNRTLTEQLDEPTIQVDVFEREIQRCIDCQHIINVMEDLEDNEVCEYECALLDASNIIDVGIMFTKDLHQMFKNNLRKALGVKAKLERLIEIQLDVVDDCLENISEVDITGLYHIKVLHRSVIAFEKPDIPDAILKKLQVRKNLVGVSFRSISQLKRKCQASSETAKEPPSKKTRIEVCSTSTESRNHSRQLEQHHEGREAEKHTRKRPYSPNTSVSSQVAEDKDISAKRRRLDESEPKHSSLYEHQSPTPTSSQTYKTYSDSKGQSRYPGHRERSENRRDRNGRNSRGNNDTHASKRRHRHEHKKHHEHSQRYQQHSMVRHTHREHRSGRGQNQNGETTTAHLHVL